MQMPVQSTLHCIDIPQTCSTIVTVQGLSNGKYLESKMIEYQKLILNILRLYSLHKNTTCRMQYTTLHCIDVWNSTNSSKNNCYANPICEVPRLAYIYVYRKRQQVEKYRLIKMYFLKENDLILYIYNTFLAWDKIKYR